MILQPTLLWDCWSPKALGAYPDVKSLWTVWQEGALVEGVGRAPPLQLVEAEWGHHKDKRTGKGRLPAWRPRKDEKVNVLFLSDLLFTDPLLGTTTLVPVHVVDQAH